MLEYLWKLLILLIYLCRTFVLHAYRSDYILNKVVSMPSQIKKEVVISVRPSTHAITSMMRCSRRNVPVEREGAINIHPPLVVVLVVMTGKNSCVCAYMHILLRARMCNMLFSTIINLFYQTLEVCQDAICFLTHS